jgi:hypothetical protein
MCLALLCLCHIEPQFFTGFYDIFGCIPVSLPESADFFAELVALQPDRGEHVLVVLLMVLHLHSLQGIQGYGGIEERFQDLFLERGVPLQLLDLALAHIELDDKVFDRSMAFPEPLEFASRLVDIMDPDVQGDRPGKIDEVLKVRGDI